MVSRAKPKSDRWRDSSVESFRELQVIEQRASSCRSGATRLNAATQTASDCSEAAEAPYPQPFRTGSLAGRSHIRSW